MIERLSKIFGLSLLMAGLSIAVARADTIAFDTVNPPAVVNHDPNNPVNLGLVFTPNSNITVTALGFYDEPTLSGSENIGLYDSLGTLLVSTALNVPANPTFGYIFGSVAGPTLIGGNQYTLAAFTGANAWAYGAPPSTSADITFDTTTYTYGASPAFPTSTYFGNTQGYFGPNFQYVTAASAVPEPLTLSIFGAGLAGVAVVRRRRKSAKQL